MPEQFLSDKKEDGFNFPHAVKRWKVKDVQRLIPANVSMQVQEEPKDKIP